MNIAERVLYTLGVLLYTARLHRVIMWLTRRIPKVVLYHAVAPEEDDAIRGIDANVPPATFARHLDFYKRYYTIVSVDRLAQDDVPDYAVAITFDDGYRSVFEHAVPELAARGLTATVYLVPSVIGNDTMIWVNELNWLARRHPVETARAFRETFHPADAEFGARAMIDYVRAHYSTEAVRSLLTAIHRAVGSSTEQLARTQHLYLDWDEVDRLGAAGITVGNHTWSHPNTPRLPRLEQAREIDRTATRLRGLPHWLPSFAFPFGDADATGREIAVSTGHRTVCEVGGLNAPLRPDRLARVPVRAHTGSAGLFAELELVATLKELVRRVLARS